MPDGKTTGEWPLAKAIGVATQGDASLSEQEEVSEEKKKGDGTARTEVFQRSGRESCHQSPTYAFVIGKDENQECPIKGSDKRGGWPRASITIISIRKLTQTASGTRLRAGC